MFLKFLPVLVLDLDPPTIDEWSGGKNNTKKSDASQNLTTNVDSKFVPVNFDVSDWGGEEDWKSVSSKLNLWIVVFLPDDFQMGPF